MNPHDITNWLPLRDGEIYDSAVVSVLREVGPDCKQKRANMRVLYPYRQKGEYYFFYLIADRAIKDEGRMPIHRVLRYGKISAEYLRRNTMIDIPRGCYDYYSKIQDVYEPNTISNKRYMYKSPRYDIQWGGVKDFLYPV